MKNATFWLFWHSRRPKPAEKPRKACPGPLPGAQSLAGNSPGLLRACPGPPLACRGAPQRLPRVASGHPKACQGARQDLARPAPGRSSLAEELRKACSGPPRACRGAPEGLPRTTHGLLSTPGQLVVATRRLQQFSDPLSDLRQCRKSVRTCSSPLSTSLPNASSRGVAKRN